MGKNIMVNGWMISRMDVEPITGHKIVDMRVNGKMEKCMAQALKYKKMAANTLALGIITKNMVKVYRPLSMEINIKVHG